MAYSAQNLISNAYYLSGIVSSNKQAVSGQQISQGLRILNQSLSVKSFEPALIPYYERNTSLTFVPNQESYFLPNCIDIESITFFIGDVQYSMEKLSRTNYFGISRANNVQTLPRWWTFLREEGGGTLYVYFFPNEAYPVQMTVKYALTNVTLNQDLSLSYDGAYITYLEFDTARRLCMFYGVEFPDSAAAELRTMELVFSYVSPPDLSIHKRSVLQRGSPLNMGDVNLGRGFRPC